MHVSGVSSPPPFAVLSLPAGVGFGGVLAHELALQLAASSADPPLALALLDAPQSLRNPGALLSWLLEAQRQEMCQAAAALYPAVAAAAGTDAPSFEAFVSRLASVAVPEEQLDYVATFKPAEVRVWWVVGWVGLFRMQDAPACLLADRKH